MIDDVKTYLIFFKPVFPTLISMDAFSCIQLAVLQSTLEI